MNEIKKFIHHGVDSEMVRQEVAGMSDAEALAAFKNRAVCPRCEKWAYRDVGWTRGRVARCPACGWRGRTVTVDEFIAGRMYR